MVVRACAGCEKPFDHYESGPSSPKTERCPSDPRCPPVGGKLVPARPAGASWCGAHDMAGNVREWTTGSGVGEDWKIVSGSFRSADPMNPYSTAAINGPDDATGFRVALSAIPS